MHLEENSLPKSEIRVLHTPYFVNSCVSANATVNVSLLAMCIVTKYLLNISKHVRTYSQAGETLDIKCNPCALRQGLCARDFELHLRPMCTRL